MNSTGTAPPVRWGIVGTGVVAQAFADDLALVPDARLVAVTSRDPARAMAFAEMYPGCRAADTVEGLARIDGVDIVYIASPHDQHRTHALACIDAGRAVLCEKPFTRTAAEARDVVDAARRAGVFCMEAMWMRFHPLVLRVRDLVQSGALGQIRLLTADFGYPTPFAPESRFFDPNHGGGALLDRGVYLLSLARFLLGAPLEIEGKVTIGPTGVDEQEALVCRHEGGSLAVLTSSLRSRLGNEAVVVGTLGQVRIHDPFYAPHRVSWTRAEEPLAVGEAARPAPAASRGLKGRIKRSRFARMAVEVVARPLLGAIRGGRRFAHYERGRGYGHEAVEAIRCLREGLRESPLMPLDETVAILEDADRLRHAWGLTFPSEPSPIGPTSTGR